MVCRLLVALLLQFALVAVPVARADAGVDAAARAASTVVADKKRKDADANNAFVGFGRGAVSPSGKQWGLGLQLGFPTSITAKIMLNQNQGIVIGAGGGLGFAAFPSLSLHADYLWHPHVLASAEPFVLSWFVGGGLWVGGVWPYGPRPRPFVGVHWWDTFGPVVPVWLGARVPVGLNLALRALPIEFYGELTPALLVFPSLAPGVGATLGFRVYL